MLESNQKNKDVRGILLKYAANILSRRPYFFAQLKQKLHLRAQKLELEDCTEEINSILTDLQKSGYLKDSYLAEAFIRRCLSKGQGPKIIKYKLSHLGLTSQQINAALSTEESQKALEEAKNKLGRAFSKDEDYKLRSKLYQRGF